MEALEGLHCRRIIDTLMSIVLPTYYKGGSEYVPVHASKRLHAYE